MAGQDGRRKGFCSFSTTPPAADQVAPLLPGAAGCLVLVTSRRYLGDLPSGAGAACSSDTLPPDDACAMFVTLARASAEPDLVAEMVDLCGYLPLAITLLARLFARHRSWDMTDLIAQTQAKLLTVAAENRTVAAAFELSYQYLTDPAAAVLRPPRPAPRTRHRPLRRRRPGRRSLSGHHPDPRRTPRRRIACRTRTTSATACTT